MERNQCDGCNCNMVTREVNGTVIHYDRNTERPIMVCTKDLYEDQVDWRNYD